MAEPVAGRSCVLDTEARQTGVMATGPVQGLPVVSGLRRDVVHATQVLARISVAVLPLAVLTGVLSRVAMLVHTTGVDFTLLDPPLLAMALRWRCPWCTSRSSPGHVPHGWPGPGSPWSSWRGASTSSGTLLCWYSRSVRRAQPREVGAECLHLCPVLLARRLRLGRGDLLFDDAEGTGRAVVLHVG